MLVKAVGQWRLLKQPALMGDPTIIIIIVPIDLASLRSDLAIMVKLDLVMMNLDWKWL